jgi:SAM-dependent methyltransferase
MAQQFPGGSYVGIDYSAREIAEGRADIEALGLTNIELRLANIVDLTAELGKFDFIIAHGVYSWVPPEVQRKLLRVCRQSLAPTGVAYVSYNTLPGWHPVLMVREMMLYHVRSIHSPREKVAQARIFLQFLAESVFPKESPYAGAIQQEFERLSGERDDSFAHDALRAYNEPIYFHEFVERAGAAGLRYVAESPLRSMSGAEQLDRQVFSSLQEWSPGLLERQQYIAFLDGETFRRSLLTHLDANIDPEHCSTIPDNLRVAGRFVDEPASDGIAAGFESQSETTVSNPIPLLNAAQRHLTAIWPQSCTFTELTDAAIKILHGTLSYPPSKVAIAALRLMLDSMSVSGGVQLSLEPWPFVHEPGERPKATSLARRQAAKDGQVTSQAHMRIALDPPSALVLALCDGQRTQTDIATAFVSALTVTPQSVAVELDGKTITDEGELRDVANKFVAQAIRKFVSDALLI